MNPAGSYLLLIFLDTDIFIPVGKLGRFTFNTGYYVYAGSALGGLRGRIGRHLKKGKKVHWHIDYLLQYSEVVEVWMTISQERLECFLAQTIINLPGASVPVPGFGSSDCRCRTHLIGLSAKLEMAALQNAIGPCITLERLLVSDAR